VKVGSVAVGGRRCAPASPGTGRICPLGGLIALLASSVAMTAETMFPVPQGATEIGHVVLQPGADEEDHFFLTERYPGAPAVKHYSAFFSQWSSCDASKVGWDSFADASRPEPRFVHQLARYWVNQRNNVAVILVLRYESPGLTTQMVPSSDRQFVAVMRLRHHDVAKELAGIGVRCAG
jgi:hypothetical protein